MTVIQLILSMTFSGSIISLFLFAIKPMIKEKLPKSFQYYMWLSVVIALLLPVSRVFVIPVSSYSVMPTKSTYDIAQWISDAAWERPVNFILAPQNQSERSVGQILCFFWQSGAILVLGFHMICYVSYSRRLGKGNVSASRQEMELLNRLLKRKGTLRLYKNPMAKTPFLIGFFHPAVVLPDKKYEDAELRNILMHEITHLKRHDIFVKWLFILAGAIHWFNPLVYFARREMDKACELACDEFVIKGFAVSEMQQYGDTLIAVAADSIRKTPLSATMFEDKRNLKERLDAIMEHKKYSKRAVITASAILVMIVCTVLGFGVLHDTGKEHKGKYNLDLFSPSDQMRIKAMELAETIRNYDKENIAKADVYFGHLDYEITNAYLFVVCKEKNPDSEMLSGIKALAAEELALDTSDIQVEFIDFDESKRE